MALQTIHLKKIEKYLEKIIYIKSRENRGKGHAMSLALEQISEGLVVILDADVLNFNNENLLMLCLPVANNEVRFTLGTTKQYTFNNPGKMASLLGQRCYKFDDLKPLIVEIKSTSKYGLEILLNKKIPWRDYKLVFLKGTKHLIKTEKYFLLRAIKGYIYEGLSIIQQYLKLK